MKARTPVSISLDSSVESVYFQPSVSEGQVVTVGALIGMYSLNSAHKFSQKVESPVSGTVRTLAKVSPTNLLDGKVEGRPQEVAFCQIEVCPHEIVYHGVCVECSEHISQAGGQMMYKGISNLRVDCEKAVQMQIDSYEKQRKLIAVLDLDNTLIHGIPLESIDLSQYPESSDLRVVEMGPGISFAFKLRPHVRFFIEELAKDYDIYVYTFATRDYALEVLKLLNTPKQLLDVA